jgi:hypothetical protein
MTRDVKQGRPELALLATGIIWPRQSAACSSTHRGRQDLPGHDRGPRSRACPHTTRWSARGGAGRRLRRPSTPFDGYAGEAFAWASARRSRSTARPPDGWPSPSPSPTSPRLRWSLSRVKLSANWMAAAGAPGGRVFDTVKAVALDLCPRLGVGIPVAWTPCRCDHVAGRDAQAVVSPLSLIISAFGPCHDILGVNATAAHRPRGDRPRLSFLSPPRPLPPQVFLPSALDRIASTRRARGAPRRVPRPRLPRPLRRRALRHARRDGVRRPHGTDRGSRAARRPRGRHRPPAGRALQRGAGRVLQARPPPGPRPRGLARHGVPAASSAPPGRRRAGHLRRAPSSTPPRPAPLWSETRGGDCGQPRAARQEYDRIWTRLIGPRPG